jgi:hypothetical protein
VLPFGVIFGVGMRGVVRPVREGWVEVPPPDGAGCHARAGSGPGLRAGGGRAPSCAPNFLLRLNYSNGSGAQLDSTCAAVL